MPGAIYHIVFHDGHWRIRFEDLHLGEFDTAQKAAEAAIRVARSRLVPPPHVQVTSGPEGEITIGSAQEST